MMQVIRNWESLLNNKPSKACVATIGNFDGLHCGHKHLIGQLVNYAKEDDLPSLVISFNPAPKEFFSNNKKVAARLTTISQRLRILSDWQVNQVAIIRFNQRLSNFSPEQFIANCLSKAFNVKRLFVGKNFQFGKDRAGNFQTLQQFSEKYGYKLHSEELLTADKDVISSTRVRTALANNDLPLANKLLGRPFRVISRVQKGDQRGAKLGYPTANCNIPKRIFVPKGVFVVAVKIDQKYFYGMANVGTRPTFAGDKQLIEVHLFDFAKNIYGKKICIDFLCYIRQEQKFSSIEQIKSQLKLDEQFARSYQINEATQKSNG